MSGHRNRQPAESASLRVLFLCTGNSARSQLAEAVLRHLSRGRVDVVSAGSAPSAEIHPLARAAARRVLGVDLEGQYPKRLDQLTGGGFDYVITVCGRAAEACPALPGDPARIHWSIEDPAAVEGSEEDRQRAFDRAAQDVLTRVRLWMALPAVSAAIEASTPRTRA